MYKDFDIIQLHFDKDIVIYPIADVHYKAIGCLEEEFKKFVKKILAQDNAYVILCGDLIDNNIVGSVASPFDGLRPREQKREMAEILKPLAEANRIIGILPGNHETRKANKEADDDAMYDIAAKLNLEDVYRENMLIIKIQFGDKAANGLKNPTYVLGAVHGNGGGARTGSAVNRTEDFGMVFDGLDVLISAHVHKSFRNVPAKIVIDKFNNKVSEKPFINICCPSWLSYAGYPVKGMLRPATTADKIEQSLLFHHDKKMVETQASVTW